MLNTNEEPNKPNGHFPEPGIMSTPSSAAVASFPTASFSMPRRHSAVPLTFSVSDGAIGVKSASLAKGKFPAVGQLMHQLGTVQEREEFMYQLLASMPRSQLSSLQQRIAPLLQFDVVGSLPTEVALQIFSHLPPISLLTCALVSRRWQVLSNDQSLWKVLCLARGWEWRQPVRPNNIVGPTSHSVHRVDNDDEGMGDSDDEDVRPPVEGSSSSFTEMDSGFASISMIQVPSQGSTTTSPSSSRDTMYISRQQCPQPQPPIQRARSQDRHSAPPVIDPSLFLKPNCKLLYRTNVQLRNRFMAGRYRLSVIQTRGNPQNGHMNMIYCVQLYTYPSTNLQVLFTGSRDKTIREWNLKTGTVERVIDGAHTGSVLSLCVRNGYLASAGSDRRVVVWDLEKNKLVKVIMDHQDSVLCVRFDAERLVSCSKDRTVRVYSFPDLELVHVLGAHRAAVNAVSLSKTHIVSGSGDRSMRVWDVKTGKLVRTFEDHHIRGIASIDFKPPYIVSGSSDKHIRVVDMNTAQGWSTSPEYGNTPFGAASLPASITHTSLPLSQTHASTSADANSSTTFAMSRCQSCGSTALEPTSSSSTGTGEGSSGKNELGIRRKGFHVDLVRSVSLGPDFVITGSYDLTVKIWDRETGALVADLTGGHTGKIFCVDVDRTKVVSCGEDQRICVWDFSHGIDTSFIQTSYY